MGLGAIGFYPQMHAVTKETALPRLLSPAIRARVAAERIRMHEGRTFMMNMAMGGELNSVERAADAITQAGPRATVAQLVDLRTAMFAVRRKALEHVSPTHDAVVQLDRLIRELNAVINAR